MASGTAEQITRASKSNLAATFVALPPERRRDITTFYGFCRVVDDLADEPGPTAAERFAALDGWKACLTAPQPGESPLAAEVRALIEKYRLPVDHFIEIILAAKWMCGRRPMRRGRTCGFTAIALRVSSAS